MAGDPVGVSNFRNRAGEVVGAALFERNEEGEMVAYVQLDTDLFGDPVADPINPVGGDPRNAHLKPNRRRRTDIVSDRIAVGKHPLTNGPLHPEADRKRTKDSDPAPFTCGTCMHRGPVGHNTRSYPKCLIPLPGVPDEPPPEAMYDPAHTEAQRRAQQRAFWSWHAGRYPRVSRTDATDVRAWWPACPAYQPEETPDV